LEENDIDEFVPRSEKAATITRRMTITAKKLEQQMIEEQLEDVEYCPICYTNEVQEGTTAVNFECGHTFCLECTLEQLRQLISRAEVEKVKCFDYECLAAISDTKLQEIFSANDMADLMDRFKHFKEKKDLDKDPLVRYCPKAGCDQHMLAEDSNCVKL